MTRDQLLQIGEILFDAPEEKISVFLDLAQFETGPVEAPPKIKSGQISLTKKKESPNKGKFQEGGLTAHAIKSAREVLAAETRNTISVTEFRQAIKEKLLSMKEEGKLPQKRKTIKQKMTPTSFHIPNVLQLEKDWKFSPDKGFLVRKGPSKGR